MVITVEDTTEDTANRLEDTTNRMEDTTNRLEDFLLIVSTAGNGATCPALEQSVVKVNMTTGLWNMEYVIHPTRYRSSGVMFVVDSSHGAIMAAKLGWGSGVCQAPKKYNWSWGIPVLQKDIRNRTLRSLVIPPTIMSAINSPYRIEGVTLLRGPRHSIVPSTQSLYFDREFSVPIRPDRKSGNASAPTAMTTEGAQEQIRILTAQMAALEKNYTIAKVPSVDLTAPAANTPTPQTLATRAGVGTSGSGV